MAESPTTQEQADQLAGRFNDICVSIKRFVNYGWGLPHADPHSFIQDNFRVLDRQIHIGIDGVSVLDGFKGDIDDVSCEKWRGKTKYALRQLSKLNRDFASDSKGEDYDLGKGRASFKLNILPIRDFILEYIAKLEKTDFLGDAAQKPKAARKTRKSAKRRRAKRERPTVQMMQVHESRERGLSLRAIGRELHKSPETIRRWDKIAADWSGDNARSKRVRQGLLPNTPDPKALTPDDDALAS